MEGFFIHVRELLEAENTSEYVQNKGLGLFVSPEKSVEETPKGQQHVAVITPGRMISLAPAPLPNTKSEMELASIKALLPGETHLQITAISYTKLEAYLYEGYDENEMHSLPRLLVGICLPWSQCNCF
jgi:hypothetical protein